MECRLIVMSVGLLMSGLLFAGIATAGPPQENQSPKPLRAGIIGLDTSHVVAFTQLLNAREPKPELAGVRVVAAYPGGSPDIPSSRDRVAGYTKSCARSSGSRSSARSTSCSRASTSCCSRASTAGRTSSRRGRSSSPQAGVHRQAGRRLAGRRDRDLRAGAGDGHALFLELVAPIQPGRRRDAATTPRSARSSVATPTAPARSKSITPTCSGTAFTASRRSSRSWGPAASRSRAFRPRGPSWSRASGTGAGSGRFAAFATGHHEYGGTVFGTKGIAPVGGYGGYEPLVVEIVKFFKTGKPPVERRGDARDLRLHGSRRREQAPGGQAGRRSRASWPRPGPQLAK